MNYYNGEQSEVKRIQKEYRSKLREFSILLAIFNIKY